MPQLCRTCCHPKRRELEDRVGAGMSMSAAASRYAISKDSIWRHFNSRHLERAGPRPVDSTLHTRDAIFREGAAWAARALGYEVDPATGGVKPFRASDVEATFDHDVEAWVL